MIHNYFIDYEYSGTFFHGPNDMFIHDDIPDKITGSYPSHRTCNFHVYSEKEISPEKLQSIITKALDKMPKDLFFEQFQREFYRQLEKRGLKEFQKSTHKHDHRIVYNQLEPEHTAVRMGRCFGSY